MLIYNRNKWSVNHSGNVNLCIFYRTYWSVYCFITDGGVLFTYNTHPMEEHYNVSSERYHLLNGEKRYYYR